MKLQHVSGDLLKMGKKRLGCHIKHIFWLNIL